MAAAVSSSVRSAQKRSSATICLRTRRKRRSSASVSLASAADGHSEGQWTPNRLSGEHSWKAPSTLRPRAPWGWFWGWVPSCGWCSEAPWRAKSGGRRSDLRKLEVDRGPFSAGGGGATPSQRTAAQSLVKQKSGCQSLVTCAVGPRNTHKSQWDGTGGGFRNSRGQAGLSFSTLRRAYPIP